jgi:hypothetical protein
MSDSILTKDSILAADDSRVEALDVPEWGGRVHLRVMSGTDRDRMERNFLAQKEGGAGEAPGNIRAMIACLTLCDAEGALLFDSNGDIEALGRKSAAALDRVFSASMRLNRFGEDDVEGLAKN